MNGLSCEAGILFRDEDDSLVGYALIMEAVRASETSAYFYETTRRYIQAVIFVLAAVRT
jgi:hypothetical protein